MTLKFEQTAQAWALRETELEMQNQELRRTQARLICEIADMKQLEEERTTLAAQLHQARKLETLGILAVGISHDFSNLLTTIMCNASTGGRMVEGNLDLARFFEAIETSALKASELLRQLLAYAGRAKWVIEEVDLGIIVKELCQSLTFSLPWNLTLTCSLADRVPYWQGDAIQVYQMAMNLVMNSFEAFPEGAPGEIAIRTRAEGLTGTEGGAGTWVLPAAPGRYVVLEVEDTGTGMTPETLARAFEPFFTTKASGRGLGLAAVQGILGSHGGGLWIRSRPGRGTTIRIYLPAMTEARGDLGGEVLSSWRGQGRVLVVDCERAGRSLTRAMAVGFGFSVLEAGGGLEAIEAFRLQHGELALVLVDRGLKGTTALEVLRALKARDSGVPVVFTADHDWRDGDPGSAGGVETLHRPFRPAEAQRILQRAMAARSGRQPAVNGARRLPASH